MSKSIDVEKNFDEVQKLCMIKKTLNKTRNWKEFPYFDEVIYQKPIARITLMEKLKKHSLYIQEQDEDPPY